MTVSGYANLEFDVVRDAFEKNFSAHGDVGAACAIYHRGKPVVDLWGGYADKKAGKTWEKDSIALTFSVTKGLTATCIHLLVDDGVLNIDRPICEFWPEFAAAGKEKVTTRMVLNHSAGLAAIDARLSLDEVLAWEPVVNAIAAQRPNWEPGARHGYHARTFGWILGEIIRRLTGQPFNEFLQKRICEPLGIDFWVGLPEPEFNRLAITIPPQSLPFPPATLAADSLSQKVMSGPSGLFGYNEMWNRPEVLRAVMPSSNGVGTARALAKFYAALNSDLPDVELIPGARLSDAVKPSSRGPDAVIMVETCFGLGYSLPPMLSRDCGKRAYGHPGAGGSLAFCDPEFNLSFAYVTNTMKFDLQGDPRSSGLIKAAYQCLHES